MAVAFTMDAPRPFEANPGLISFHSSTPVDRLEVRIDGRVFRIVDLPAPTRRSTVGPIGLPSRDVTVTVTGFSGSQRVGSQTASDVLGLPRASMSIRPIGRTSVRGQVRMRRLPRPAEAVAGWAVDLSAGTGASYNAGARFTAASTAKLPILIALLINRDEDIVGSEVWGSVQSMIRRSSNDAANDVLTALGGSTASGGAITTAIAHRLGAVQTEEAAGYLADDYDRRLRPPVLVDNQPDVPCCKVTTAHDLGILMQSIVEAAAGRGRARRLGLTGRDARVALWLLAHTDSPGLIAPWTRFITAHKIGDVNRAWHDVAAVFTLHGPLIVVAMTDSAGGVDRSASAHFGRGVLEIALEDLPAPAATGPDR